MAILVLLPQAMAFAQTPADNLEGIKLLPEEREAIKAALTKPIQVGMTDSPPFSQYINGKWEGLSVYLLKAVAEDLDIAYKIKPYTVSSLITALEKGEIDVGACALNITAERAEQMEFSHAFHHGGYGVAVSVEINSRTSFLKRFFSGRFIYAAGYLLLILFIVGILVWLFERRHSESDFGGGVTRGLGSGLWWSAVTMSTVGYGDKSPRTLGGRALAVIWIFSSVILISYFTAAIASSLTVGKMTSVVQEIADLKHIRTGTVKGSSAESFIRERGIRTTSFNTLEEALESIKTSEVDAVVNDAEVLRETISGRVIDGVIMTNVKFGNLDYAFAFPVKSPLVRPISIEILRTTETAVWPAVLRRYLRIDPD